MDGAGVVGLDDSTVDCVNRRTGCEFWALQNALQLLKVNAINRMP